jgi:hypothetical protein
MATRIPFQWNTANFNWDATNPTDGKTYPPNEIVTGTNLWDDCALIIDIINVMQGGGSPDEYFKKNPEKKKRFIKLLCQVQGKEYKETKEVHKTKIFISDIKLVAKEVLGVDVKIDR